MYYLLCHRLNHQLRKQFEIHEHQLLDNFDDIIGDFFFYLREGKNKENNVQYLSLQRIKKREAFGLWILRTFRNYLNMRAAKEGQIVLAERSADNVTDTDAPSSVLTDEKKLYLASKLIAYAHQVFSPRERFIFLRILLILLNKKQALPNKVMAHALGMNDVSYRVTVHRIKCILAIKRNSLLQGEPLHLDDQHQQMAQHINDDFTCLYPILLDYYNQAIDTLNCAETIRQLRQKYYTETGNMLHEPETSYHVRYSLSIVWNILDFLLESL